MKPTDALRPSRRRRAAIALGAAAALALSAGAIWRWRQPARPTAPAADATAAALFELELPDADGVQRPLKNWRGKLLIVNFWATWCAPCVEEMPELQQLAEQPGPRELAVVGIGVDDADRIREFRTLHGLRIPLLVAGFDGMTLAQKLGNTAAVLPYTVLISPDGRILKQHVGRVHADQLRRWAAE